MDIRNATPEQRAELNALIRGALNTPHRKTKVNNADALKAWGITTRKDWQKFIVIWNGGELSCDYDERIEYRANSYSYSHRVTSNGHGTRDGRSPNKEVDFVGLLIAQRTGEYTMRRVYKYKRGKSRRAYYTTRQITCEEDPRYDNNDRVLYRLQSERKDITGDLAWDEKCLARYEKDIKDALYALQCAYEQQATLKLKVAKRKAEMEDDIEKANANIREFLQSVRCGQTEEWKKRYYI